MNYLLSPKGFLTVGGVVLVVVGLLGFIGIIGPTPESSLFGEAWWFDNGENWAHLILGVVALAASFGLKNAAHQKMLVMVVGVVGILFGILNFFLPAEAPNFLGANLENPTDTILHLVVGVWALAAGMGEKDMSMGMSGGMPSGPKPMSM